jgi:hypothetical protein
MRKLITLTLAVLLVGLFAAVVFAAVDASDDSSSTVGTTETSPTTDTTETTETTETTTTDDDGTADRGRDRDRDGGDRRENDAPAGGVDISGPCDEAEHANDPRCTGVAPRVEDDDAHGHDRGDDHGGDREDNSGPGNGGDDAEEHDNSGPGNGDDSGDDDDHSGHGGGGDDD